MIYCKIFCKTGTRIVLPFWYRLTQVVLEKRLMLLTQMHECMYVMPLQLVLPPTECQWSWSLYCQRPAHLRDVVPEQ